MKLVLLFFCIILAIFINLLLLILLSSIKLNIKKCYISNIKGNIKKKGLDKEFLAYLEFYLFGLIKIARIRITKKLIKRIYIKENLNNIERDVKIIKFIRLRNIVKKLKLKLERFDFKLELGTDSPVWTAYIVGVISSIIRNNYRSYQSKKKRILCFAIV